MRLIGQLPSPDLASAFSDALYLRGIDCELALAPPHRAVAGMVEVWVLDEDRVEEARALHSRFIALPASPEFRDAPAQAAAKRAADASQAATATRDLEKRAAPALSAFNPARQNLVTKHILLAAGITFVLFFHFPGLRAAFLPIPSAILRGQIWRLLAPALLHRDFWHLLLMLFWTYDLGTPVERRLGHLPFAVLALALVAIGSIAQSFFDPLMPVGLGVLVYGLLGYHWTRSRLSPPSAPGVNPYTPLLLAIYLVLALLGVLGPLPLPAYLSSLLSGALLAFFPSRRR